MGMNLYVGGLAYSVTDDELKEFFASEGTVTSAVVIKDRESGQSKGFGFVEMEDEEEGKKAMEKLNGKELNGRAVNISEARPREERSDRRPSGGNNGGGNRGFGGGGNRRRY